MERLVIFKCSGKQIIQAPAEGGIVNRLMIWESFLPAFHLANRENLYETFRQAGPFIQLFIIIYIEVCYVRMSVTLYLR